MMCTLVGVEFDRCSKKVRGVRIFTKFSSGPSGVDFFNVVKRCTSMFSFST